MKSYTDIKQSEKLAEILPLDSADMRFCFSHTLGGRIIGHYPMIGREPSMGTVPCWSLTALVNVLPRIDIEKEIWYSENYDYRVKAYIGDGYVGDWYDNPIDACVEMIFKLKERNLI